MPICPLPHADIEDEVLEAFIAKYEGRKPTRQERDAREMGFWLTVLTGIGAIIYSM